MLNCYGNFEGGKLIAAVCRNFVCPGPTAYEVILRGIDYEKVEVIFPTMKSESDIGDIILVHLKCQEKATVITSVEKLSNHSQVIYAEPNYLFGRHVVPNDPYFSYLWGLEKIKAPKAWNYTVGCADVVVGVADSGIDYYHQDVRDNIWVSKEGSYGWNFIEGNSNSMDVAGHGTHVAGTIGAVGNNLLGVVGVCWHVKMASLKIGDVLFSLAAAISSINYVIENDIQILNNSWGGRQYSPSLKHAIEHYSGLYIVSSGNYGTNNDIIPDYPASYDSDNILSVAASSPDDALTPFSNYGAKSVDIAAPGVDILSLELHNGYSYERGTSMAAPHVSGAAALLKSFMPNLTAADIKHYILQSADKHPSLAGKVATGGVLNVNAMLEMANKKGD